ncbi:MAG: hypothetical protein QXT45_02710 [Candidatus Bilamarchaeaceae archaeon]
MKYIVIILGIIFLLNAVMAGCSLDAYKKACANCKFDENGKMDKACADGYKTSGLSCISAEYPIMSAKYYAGECNAPQECVLKLSKCISEVSSGNDKFDCQQSEMLACYSSADECMRRAAFDCGEVERQCPGPAAILLLVISLFGFYAISKKY